MPDQRDHLPLGQVQRDPVQKPAAGHVHGKVFNLKQTHRCDLIISQTSQGAPISEAKSPSGNS